MKCPKCRNDMKRTKIDESIYTYVCTRCNFQLPTIKNKDEETQQSVSNDETENSKG